MSTPVVAAGPGSAYKGGIVRAERDGRVWYDLTRPSRRALVCPTTSSSTWTSASTPSPSATIEDVRGYLAQGR